jgi:ubiquinone/menaquinone biosynthesis C-methylase UbiE
VQRYGWDAAAKHYDELWRENLSSAHRVMFDLMQLKPAERVLEMACGSSFLTLQAASQVGIDGHVLATDISAEMISLLQKRTADLRLENIKTERVAAEDLA